MTEAATASESREAPAEASGGTPQNGHARDAVDAAIAATEPRHVTIEVALGPGRVARLLVPMPLTATDVGRLAGVLAEVYHTTQNAPTEEQLAAAAARSRLVLPK